MTTTFLVTGASGQLGQRVIELLVARGLKNIVSATRHPEKLQGRWPGVEVRRADFDDEASLNTAFRGVTRALLISTDALDKPGHRLAQQQRAVKALAAAGVKHVVYTSLPAAEKSPVSFAPDHYGTEQALEKSGVGYTILRNNLYTDLQLFSLPGALASGKLVTARGNGKVAYVTREDCAQAAAGALADEKLTQNEVLDVTGPEALSGDQLAAIVSKLTGKPLQHLSVPAAAFIQGLAEHGVPGVLATVYATFDEAASQGLMGHVTDSVKRFSGKAPQSVEAFLTEHRAKLS